MRSIHLNDKTLHNVQRKVLDLNRRKGDVRGIYALEAVRHTVA